MVSAGILQLHMAINGKSYNKERTIGTMQGYQKKGKHSTMAIIIIENGTRKNKIYTKQKSHEYICAVSGWLDIS